MRWDKFDATKMQFGLHLPQLTHESKICCCTFSSKPPYRIYLDIIWTFNLHPDVRNRGFFLTLEIQVWKIQFFSKISLKVI